MQTPSADLYVAAFTARCEAMRRSAAVVVAAPGIHGLVSRADEPLTRLLVTDDRAYDVLAALLPDARAGTIRVFEAAERCAALVAGHAAWKPKAVSASVCRDLARVPAVPLPDGLACRAVRRRADDPIDGVPLDDVVAAALLADPSIDEAPDAFANVLRSMSPGTRLFAAVDRQGVVRATSGCVAFGAEASVFFINTEPGWRRRGIGAAMTVAALRGAQDRGARRASLDASETGLSIYLRLGFEVVSRATQFSRAS